MKKNIKNIVFDVGEVLLTYRWAESLAAAGVPMEDAVILGPKLFENPNWKKLDLGIEDYFELAAKIANDNPQYEKELMEYFRNVSIMPIDRPRVWSEVKRLKEKGYKLYILSNYSEYMFTEHTKNRPFVDYMDGILVSYMVHMNKPDPDIYDELFRRFDISPYESLYFDDRKENVDAAVSKGMDSILVTGEEQLITELAKL